MIAGTHLKLISKRHPAAAMTLLPPEGCNYSRIGAWQEVLELPPFDVAVQHPLVRARGKILVHVRRPMIEGLTADREATMDIHPRVFFFLGGIEIFHVCD